MTKPIIVVKVPCKLLYVNQVKEFLIKCSTSWPYLISEFLVAYITIVASDWPRTFSTPKVFLFSIHIYRSNLQPQIQQLTLVQAVVKKLQHWKCMVYIIITYIPLCVGESKGIAGQYILYCPPQRAI